VTLGDCPTPYSRGKGRFAPCHGENSRKIHIRRILPSTQRDFQGVLASGFRKKRTNLHTKFTFAVLSLPYSLERRKAASDKRDFAFGLTPPHPT
jgi:hypothetical protein